MRISESKFRKIVREEISKVLKSKQIDEVSADVRQNLDSIRLFLSNNYDKALRQGSRVIAYDSGPEFKEDRVKVVIKPGRDRYTYKFDANESDKRFAEDVYQRMKADEHVPAPSLPPRFRRDFDRGDTPADRASGRRDSGSTPADRARGRR